MDKCIHELAKYQNISVSNLNTVYNYYKSNKELLYKPDDLKKLKDDIQQKIIVMENCLEKFKIL